MSLNGLDESAILEAHETATAEPGGWFLLKYSNREEVELLSRGNGGVVEMRKAVADYEETSPLYGFLKYRRRNVVVKYLPADCSRLIQARVAVHFNAICERFSPYDTTFEIEAAADLKDVKLSAACSLHAASCSTSSSTSSLRRRRLMEIAEEEEEEHRASKRQSTHETGGSRPRSPAQSCVALDSRLAAFPEYSEFSANSTSELPTFAGLDIRPTSSSDAEPRPDPFNYPSLASNKPKVKLGPRPSLDVSGRPRTAGNFRPVSAIPAGFKLFGKGNKKLSADKGRKGFTADATPDEETASLDFASATEETQRSKTDTVRPVTSSGASAVQVARPSQQTAKKPAISSEKARLMKAMQLRQKKQKMTLCASANDASSEGSGVPAENAASMANKTDAEEEAGRCRGKDIAKTDGEPIPEEPAVQADQKSDLTQSESRPASPVVASSEADRSTKASSVSESTDDTERGKSESPAALSDVVAGHRQLPANIKFDQDELQSKASNGAEDLDSDKENTAPAPRDYEAAAKSDVKVASSSASDATIVAVPEAVSDPSSDGSGAPEATLIPVSKFSVGLPSGREKRFKGDGSETLDIAVAAEEEEEEAAAAQAQGETADANGALASSPQWKSPDSHVSTLYSPESKVVSPLLHRASKAGHTVVSENTFVTIKSLELDSEADTVSLAEVQPRRKAAAHVEPIRTDLAQHSRHTSHSGIDFSDDDELMEELQSATLQEAKPMVVAKTPVSATFSKGRPFSNAPPAHMVRTISNPVRGNLIVPTDVSQSSARSVSTGAAYLHQVTQQQQQQGANLAKKPNIGSGISQRIKALEKLSAASGDSGTVNSRERPSSAFYAVKKRESSRPPSAVDGSNPRSASDSRPQSKDSSSDQPERSNRRRDRCEPATEASRRGRQESVSVTAKIVRDAEDDGSAVQDASDYGRLELKQSPLLVDHHKAMMPEPTSRSERRRSASEERIKSGKSRQSSLSIVKDFIKERRRSVASSQGEGGSNQARSPSLSPPMFQSGSFSPRLSISSRRSSFSREGATSPGGESGGDDGKDKKLTRAGRFMRCLSTLSGSRSKNSLSGISDAVAEEQGSVDGDPLGLLTTTTTTTTTMTMTTTVSYMGDVNVQFPDTLLWKRRNLSLDSHGFLILSALPAQSGRQAQGTKRYHLGEFRPPYVPDVEVEELPNSVVLDFVEGATSIQMACEDRAGQVKVLSILREAHTLQEQPCGL
ncbi:hypothetical protein CP532_6900 [Ophiocordyceps camponoti-leonardi (nom. inval.)]|nr:hypothetical protein CP532_6900 [Ophiocordyceps camponoti-leonardi (nom. inval.)]